MSHSLKDAVVLKCNDAHRSWQRLAASDGAQLVEMAVTLPVLVVLFVFIFDLGQAVNLKQKLTGAVREGARFAANQSTVDLVQSPPPSILAVRDVIDAYLVTSNINDCGLVGQAPVRTPSTWIWTFTTASCGGGPLVVTINRGFTFTPPSGVTVEATQVQITYPYKWQFGNMISLVASGASYTTTNVGTSAVMQNMN
jgi:Flp pilus assembly protein TadG